MRHVRFFEYFSYRILAIYMALLFIALLANQRRWHRSYWLSVYLVKVSVNFTLCIKSLISWPNSLEQVMRIPLFLCYVYPEFHKFYRPLTFIRAYGFFEIFEIPLNGWVECSLKCAWFQTSLIWRTDDSPILQFLR